MQQSKHLKPNEGSVEKIKNPKHPRKFHDTFVIEKLMNEKNKYAAENL